MRRVGLSLDAKRLLNIDAVFCLVCVALPSKKTVKHSEKGEKYSPRFPLLVNNGDFKQHVRELAYFSSGTADT